MKTWPDEQSCWLALYLVPGLGNVSFRRLLEKFGDPAGVFSAPVGELLKVEGIRAGVANRVVRRQFSADPWKEIQTLEKCGGRLITCRDPGYPEGLKELHDAPALLYVRGKDLPAGLGMVAVVGSRNATHYGLKVAEGIAEGLAREGIGVVSGMARGIDASAHCGCLCAGGHTVAVLGTGVDCVYPKSNAALMERILTEGTVISEFPMGTLPEARNFPIRNRLISGLSRGVVVVEATRRSGSLITAAQALDQGREVFAVPGSVMSFMSTGTHFLLRQGAKLVERTEDILEELQLNSGRAGKRVAPPPERVQLDSKETDIYQLIGAYPLHIDEIIRQVQMSAGEVQGALITLELKGMVKQLPGKCYVRPGCLRGR